MESRLCSLCGSLAPLNVILQPEIVKVRLADINASISQIGPFWSQACETLASLDVCVRASA